MFRAIKFLGLAIPLVFILSCSSDDDPPPPPPTDEDNASAAVTSDETETIETPDGAQMVVPEGAVPRYANGDPGTIVFSIEREDVTPTPPTNHTAITPVYRFGPEGSVLSRPVEISIPVNDGVNPEDMHMVRVNPTTNQPELYPSRYDAGRNAIVAQTNTFTQWFGTSVPPIPEAWGCLHVENLSVSTWYTFCVDSFLLEFPALDLQWMPEFAIGGVWAPAGHGPGLSNVSNFRMPQGVYWVCTQYGLDSDPSVFTSSRDSFIIADPWNETQPENLCVQHIVTASSGPTPGRCMCSPVGTPPVGTGVVQVTLTWFNASALDLDLFVEDPTGEVCGWNNTTTTSGGQLDRDNACGNYVNGQPENIFWQVDPPVGEYIVTVDWFSDCGNGISSQGIQVRSVVQGNTRTETPTIQNGENIEVMRFSVSSAGTIEFLPPQRGPRAAVHEGEKKVN